MTAVSALVRKGIFINDRGSDGDEPTSVLHLAVQQGKRGVAKLLLVGVSDMQDINESLRTALVCHEGELARASIQVGASAEDLDFVRMEQQLKKDVRYHGGCLNIAA